MHIRRGVQEACGAPCTSQSCAERRLDEVDLAEVDDVRRAAPPAATRSRPRASRAAPRGRPALPDACFSTSAVRSSRNNPLIIEPLRTANRIRRGAAWNKLGAFACAPQQPIKPCSAVQDRPAHAHLALARYGERIGTRAGRTQLKQSHGSKPVVMDRSAPHCGQTGP